MMFFLCMLALCLLVALPTVLSVDPHLRGRQLEEDPIIQLVTTDGTTIAGLLQVCQGDCNTDADCAGALICQWRGPNQPVPGCRGGENDASGLDYCINAPTPAPTPTPPIQVVQFVGDNTARGDINFTAAQNGWNGTTNDFLVNATNNATTVGGNESASVSPFSINLGKCQGVCRGDSECALGLKCYRRKLGEDVPNCAFEDVAMKQSPFLLDFCTYIPPTPSPTPVPTGQPTNWPTTATPTGQPTTRLPTESPTYNPTTLEPTTPQPTRLPTEAPTMYPTLAPKLAHFVPEPWPEYLQHCEGSCVVDADCFGDLVCHNRWYGRDAPSCYFDHGLGGIPRENDYNLCIDPRASFKPTPAPSPWPTITPYPTKAPLTPALARFVEQPWNGYLQHCEGNCTSDADCENELHCYIRGGEYYDAPSCYFDHGIGGIMQESDINVCVDRAATRPPTPNPTQAPTVTRYPTPSPTTAAPTFPPTPPPKPAVNLPLELAKVLPEPFQRFLVRCEGSCTTDFDCEGALICLQRDNGDDAPGCYFDTGAGGFAWEEDHNVCVHPDSYGGHLSYIRLWWQQGYLWQASKDEESWCMERRGDGIQIQNCDGGAGQLWEMIYQFTGKALIKAFGTNECLGEGDVTTLVECNPNRAKQQWKTMNGGWGDLHFELTREGEEYNCLANHHHPRANEVVRMRDCGISRNDTTSRWMFW